MLNIRNDGLKNNKLRFFDNFYLYFFHIKSKNIYTYTLSHMRMILGQTAWFIKKMI